jgi:predicted ester cyclase
VTGGLDVDPDEMKRIDNEVKDAIGAADLDALDRLMAPDLAAQFKADLAELYAAFPDYGGVNEEQIAEGDSVATRWVYHGTHQGEFYGVAPTGRTVTFTGISFSRFADGVMVDVVIESDELSVLRQIGASSVPPDDDQ